MNEIQKKEYSKIFEDFCKMVKDYTLKNGLEKDPQLAQLTMNEFVVVFQYLYGQYSRETLINVLYNTNKVWMLEHPSEFQVIIADRSEP